MKLGFELTLEQKQALVMTPELIQAIQILQYNTQELDDYVEEQILVNPILEEDQSHSEEHSEDEADREAEREKAEAAETPLNNADAEFDWTEYLRQREYDDISYRHLEAGFAGYDSDSEPDRRLEQYVSNDISLSEHLMFQLQFQDISLSRRQIGKYVIESLDPNGYLTQSAEEIAEQLGVGSAKVAEVIDVIRTFDPLGVASSDLSQCLLIQLEALGKDTPEARQIVTSHLKDLAANRLGHIARAVKLSVREVQEIADVIRLLEPKPGRRFGGVTENRYIIPDVVIEKSADDYLVTINDAGLPKLHISPYYRKILQQADKDSNIAQFLTGRLNSALWLIKSIEQRSQTIYNVMSAIVRYQKDFFDRGEKHLKPLTLRKIADDVGIHESTVSRSVNGKYVQTPRGVFEIKYFFSSGVRDGSADGVASGSVKALIRELIEAEDELSPLSDQTIAEMLRRDRIEISRRTIAKYRDEMGIPSSSGRRRF